jgi:hypothetical protein
LGLQAQCPPLPAPASVQVSNITSTSAYVSWTPVPGAIVYKVDIWNQITGTLVQSSQVFTTNKSVTGLVTNTNYLVNVYASQYYNCYTGMAASSYFATGIVISDDVVIFPATDNHTHTITGYDSANHQYTEATDPYFYCLQGTNTSTPGPILHAYIEVANSTSNYMEFALKATTNGQVHFPYNFFQVGMTTKAVQKTSSGGTTTITLDPTADPNQKGTFNSDLVTILVYYGNSLALTIDVSTFGPSGIYQPVQFTVAPGMRFHTSQLLGTGTPTCVQAFAAPDPGTTIHNVDHLTLGDKTIETIDAAAPMTVRPNPATDEFNIRYALAEPAECTIEVFDSYGKLITNLLNKELLDPGSYETQVLSSSWSPGLYFIHYFNGKEHQVIKVMKQ